MPKVQVRPNRCCTRGGGELHELHGYLQPPVGDPQGHADRHMNAKIYIFTNSIRTHE